MEQLTEKENRAGRERKRVPTVGAAGSHRRDGAPGSRLRPLRGRAKNDAQKERSSDLAVIGTCSSGQRQKHTKEDTQLRLPG